MDNQGEQPNRDQEDSRRGGGEWGCFRSPPNLRLSWPEPRSFESETLDLCVLNPGPLWSEPCTFAVGALDLCGLNPGPFCPEPWTFVVGTLDLCGRNPGPLWSEPWTFVVGTLDLCSQIRTKRTGFGCNPCPYRMM